MKCPKCGSGRAKYLEDRKAFHSKHKGLGTPTPRTNFDAKCEDCGFKWNTQEASVTEAKELLDAVDALKTEEAKSFVPKRTGELQ